MTTENSRQNTLLLGKSTIGSDSLFGAETNARQEHELSIDHWMTLLAEFTLALRDGAISAAAANAFANLMGKGLNSYKLQLEYAKMIGKKPDISALEAPTRPRTSRGGSEKKG